MNRLSKYAVAAVLSAAIFGSAQHANAQGLLGWFFGGGQCAGGACYSGQCYGRSCYSGQCYSAQRYGRSCASGQCSIAQNEKATSFESAIATKDEDKFSAPAPLGEDFDPLEELEESTPTCSPCQPVATCDESVSVPTKPTFKHPVAEGLKAARAAIAENVYLARVNRVRAQYGLNALTLDANLDYGCSAAVRNCAAYGAIYHASGCGAEILASNYSRGIDGALNQWLWSQAHARLLLNPAYTRCGVQTYVDANGKNYCAMRFR